MDDMQVYIANLGKYNEGELVGAWFTFPIDFEEVKEKIGLNDEYEEYAIHDYELPFTVDEYTSIGELNRLWEMVSELPEELQSELSALLTHFSSIEELSEHQEDIIIHSDCDDMYDVARYYIEAVSYTHLHTLSRSKPLNLLLIYYLWMSFDTTIYPWKVKI